MSGESKTIFITGGSGLVGSHAVEEALKRGHRVRALVRASSDTSWLDRWGVEKVVGDLEDAAAHADEYDLIIGNGHCEALAHRLHKGLVVRGFPNWEQVGNALKNDVLYEGGCYFLFEAANAATDYRAKG